MTRRTVAQGVAGAAALIAVLTLLAGLGAGLLSRWGVAARLKEYR